MDKTLKLIESGEYDLILADNELYPKLNELIKHELVVVHNERLILTEKGIEAQKLGVEKVVKREKVKKIQKDYLHKTETIKAQHPKKIILLLGVLLFLLLIILLYFLL